MASAKFLGLASVATVLAAVSIAATIVAEAGPASKSPFASNKPKAWESQTQTQIQTQTQTSPQIKWQQPGQSTQAPPSTGGTYYPGKKPAWQTQDPQKQRINSSQGLHGPSAPATQRSVQTQGSWPQGSRPQAYRPAWANQTQPRQNTQPYYGDAPQYQTRHMANNQAPVLRGASSPYAKPTWTQRLGFGNVQTSLNGHVKAGIAAMDRNDVSMSAETMFDFDLRGEASAITQGGLEYGAGLRVRAQRDRYRRGFGGLVGDCPPGIGDCTSVVVGPDNRAVKGHTGQFYTSGPEDRSGTALALEGAYLFLRSSYGDFVVGRDDGAAYLFSVGAPTLVAVSASNSPVDYTGLDSVKTYNDASGFAEKIAYTSPRLLGDSVGVGVQIGLSYAPNARACGVDYCVKSNAADPLQPFAPEIENIFELGVALDRKFSNGLSAELTGTYARGSEASNLAVFDDLVSYGLGLELKYGDFVFGTSYLNSNNGFAGQGSYTAYDAGLTWKPSKWGFSASYGYADDDIAKLTSNQGVLAVSYDLNRIRLGTGVQYVSRDVPAISLGGRTKRKQDAVALFVEAGLDF